MIEYYILFTGVIAGYVLGIVHGGDERDWFDVPVAIFCGVLWPVYIVLLFVCAIGSHEVCVLKRKLGWSR